MTFRTLHRKLGPILFLPLLVSALTGIAYRLGRSWFQLPKPIAKTFMVIHQGEYLGQPLVPVYTLLVGLGLMGLVITGLTLFRRPGQSAKSQPDRRIHHAIALIAFIPLLATGVTGMAYSLGQTWFGQSEDAVKFLLDIHQGNYFGELLRPFYILILGVSLGVLLFTGIQMTGIFRQRRTKSTTEE